jgi:hypothetical protein
MEIPEAGVVYTIVQTIFLSKQAGVAVYIYILIKKKRYYIPFPGRIEFKDDTFV